MSSFSVHGIPTLTLGTRVWIDDEDAVCLSLPAREPRYEPRPSVTCVRRLEELVRIEGDHRTIWQLFRLMDGKTGFEKILTSFALDQQRAVRGLLEELHESGAIDASGSSIRKAIHEFCKKGTLPDGGLAYDEVISLAREVRRESLEASNQLIGTRDPRMSPLRDLVERRRSPLVFSGQSVELRDLSELLNVASGPTGFAVRDGVKIPLRAYPSPGALYAIRLYAISLRVQGLACQIQEYLPERNTLRPVRALESEEAVLQIIFPERRAAFRGAALVFCMTADFERFQRKYGQGGYRALAMEAGHLSQNLCLAATALELGARPMDSVFEHRINELLGLYTSDEQFLLSVWIGSRDEE